VPTSFELTRQLAEKLAVSARDQRLASALNFVCGAMIAYDGAKGASPFEQLDVERVFAAVELLAERDTLEVSPFVASWHPAVDAWDHGPPSRPASFDRGLQRALTGERGGRGAERLITQLIQSQMRSAPSGTVYTRLGQRMVEELKHLIATTQKSIGYLQPLVAQGAAPHGLTIATLNYDVSVEHAAQAGGISLSTGIERWLQDGRWSWPKESIRLLKLHGSINWVWDRSEYVEGHLPQTTVAVTENPAADARPPAVVFGQRGKLRAQGPFLSLLAEFESQLATADRLIVIGYSFRDDHVNEAIRRWTAEDINRKIVVIDPGWPSTWRPAMGAPDDFRRILAQNLKPSPNHSEEPAVDRLEVWLEPCSAALKRLA
jgi:hypothetical protein